MYCLLSISNEEPRMSSSRNNMFVSVFYYLYRGQFRARESRIYSIVTARVNRSILSVPTLPILIPPFCTRFIATKSNFKIFKLKNIQNIFLTKRDLFCAWQQQQQQQQLSSGCVKGKFNLVPFINLFVYAWAEKEEIRCEVGLIKTSSGTFNWLRTTNNESNSGGGLKLC